MKCDKCDGSGEVSGDSYDVPYWVEILSQDYRWLDPDDVKTLKRWVEKQETGYPGLDHEEIAQDCYDFLQRPDIKKVKTRNPRKTYRTFLKKASEGTTAPKPAATASHLDEYRELRGRLPWELDRETGEVLG